MKTITITIPEELDEQAAAEARRRGISKSELIRESVGEALSVPLGEPGDDLWHSLAGFGADDVTAGSGEVDRIVYER